MGLSAVGSLCVVLGLLLLIGCSDSVQVTGGDSVKVTGEGEHGVTNQAPTLREGPYIINARSPTDGYRDPSTYQSPPVNFPSPGPEPLPPATTTSSGASLFGPGSAFYMIMDGSVTGVGYHSNRDTVDNGKGLNVKQSSSAIYGNLSLASEFIISSQSDSSINSTSVVSRRTLTFDGKDYEELERCFNNGDYIQNRLVSGAVRKDEVLAASLENTTNSATTGFYRRDTGYKMDSRFSGTYSSTARFQNTSEISDYYAGRLQITRIIHGRENYTITCPTDSPPCLGEWLPQMM